MSTDLIEGFVWLAIFLAIYFLPTIVGRRKKNVNAIFVLNFFLGWTGLGWILCMVWATMKD